MEGRGPCLEEWGFGVLGLLESGVWGTHTHLTSGPDYWGRPTGREGWHFFSWGSCQSVHGGSV